MLLAIEAPKVVAIQACFAFFILGQILLGLGGLILYTVGTSWLDENVSTKMAPIFLGILHGSQALGRVCLHLSVFKSSFSFFCFWSFSPLNLSLALCTVHWEQKDEMSDILDIAPAGC